MSGPDEPVLRTYEEAGTLPAARYSGPDAGVYLGEAAIEQADPIGERRYAVLVLGADELLRHFEFPAAWAVLSVAPDWERRAVKFMVASPEFEPVAEFAEPPTVRRDLSVADVQRRIRLSRAEDLLYDAWTVIATVTAAEFEPVAEHVREAAVRWRDAWHEFIGEPGAQRPVETPTGHSPWGQDPSGYCGCADCSAPDEEPDGTLSG